MAKNLSLGIITPIAAQIDPLLLGRVDRSMKIAEAYSERLQKDFKGKAQLSGGYPSHSFVIDFEEAMTMFSSIREPDAQECAMEDQTRQWGRIPRPNNTGEWMGLLSKEKEAPQPQPQQGPKNDTASGNTTGDTAGAGTSQPAKTTTAAAGATVGTAAAAV